MNLLLGTFWIYSRLGRATLHEWALLFYGTSTVPDRTTYQLNNPSAINISRKPFLKSRETNFLKNQNFLTGNSQKGKQAQQKSEKILGSLNSPYAISIPGQVQRKSKPRGQHKNGKFVSRPTSRPTVQTYRGLTAARGPKAGDLRLINSKLRDRSTPNPIITTTVVISTTEVKTDPPVTRKQITDLVTDSSMRQGLILMEPAAKSATNKVPEVFQQYPKIQQLYPLYPVYTGARGTGQHATRAKGLDLLQDEQFDSRNLQLDKGIRIVD